MQHVSTQIAEFIRNASWIRRMFEQGMELKKQYGAERVYDFSLGNPDVPPPATVAESLCELAGQLDRPLALGYMPNAGYPDVRAVLARRLADEQQVAVQAEHVIVSCGAAGGLNALFRALLEPGDEVVCPTPYFVEYGFYVSNSGGQLRAAAANPPEFGLDVAAIERALTANTRAVLINSPNNPTGRIYTQSELDALAVLLERRSADAGRPIYLVSDEPYRFLTYDGSAVPPVLPVYTHSVVVGSFSKSLGLAGERIGYVAVNPEMPDAADLVGGVVLTNRILGFVNAPAIGQKLAAHALERGAGVDVSVYDARRRAMARVLSDAGIRFGMPQGAFYFFPQAPTADERAFVDLLMRERVLAVPGSGFGCPGFFRLAFCVDRRVIENAADAFKRAAAAAAADA